MENSGFYREGTTVTARQTGEHTTGILRHMTDSFFTGEGLDKQLARLSYGDHACSFYDNAAEQEALIVSFVKEGLARGERCMYVVDDRTIEELTTGLNRAGVDASREQARGALQFINRSHWRNPGEFEIAAMAEGVKRLVNQALAPGWPGLWMAVEMTWALSPDIRPDRLAEWEAFWNNLIADMPVVLLCQYNRLRIPPAAIYLELKTHPLVVTPHEVYRNFYYEPPDLFLNQEAHGERVEWMLEQFKRARALEEERTQRLQERAARAQAEAAREQVTSILESITDGFFALDSQGQVTYLNKRAEQFLQVKREELLGKNAEEFPVAVRGLLSSEQCQKAIAEQVAVEFEWLFPPLNTWFAIHAYPSHNGLSVYFHDISERKRGEDALKASNAALRQANAALRRSNEDLNQFAYAASHDLQEPLRMMAVYSELLRKRYQARLDSDADQFITYVVEGAQRMEVLLKDLLEYSRVASMSQQPRVPVDCHAVLQKALSNLEASIMQSGAFITTDHLPTVSAHETCLLQLFQNLIGNAIKYRGEASPQVHISATKRGAGWVFSVRDNGIGIDPQYARQIFGIFKRLHGHQYPGTGIGLAICQKIVERYGGQIWVESEPGKGATFYFTVPAENGHDVHRPVDHPSASGPCH